MKKAIIAFIVTLLVGIIGFYIDAYHHLNANLGVILSIASMGAFNIYFNDKK